MKKILLLAGILLLSITMFGETNKITGKVYDAYNRNPLSGATIQISSGTGTRADKNGEFRFECADSVEITVSYISYEPYKVIIDKGDKFFNIGLIPTYYNLNEVTVTTSRQELNLNLLQPLSIGIITRKELNRNEGLFLDRSLNLVPGVFMEKRNLSGGQRITIRGYGSSSNTITTGFKAYLDGIPITNADGQTLLDDIDFSNIGKIEVVKGPVSSLYGTGIGGVLKMYTLQPEPLSTKIIQEGLGGSNGLWRTNTRIESGTNQASVMLNYGHQNYDGYRPHNSSSRDFATFSGNFRPSEVQDFRVFSSYTHLYDTHAGQLDSTNYYNKVNMADPKQLANNVHTEYETYRMGIAHTYKFNEYLSNQTSTFYNGYAETSAYTVGFSTYSNQNFGERTEFNLDLVLAGIKIKGTLGNELQKSISFYKNYGYANAKLDTMNLDNEIRTFQNTIFTQWEFNLPYDFLLIAGVSYNLIEFGVDDRMTNIHNPKHLDQSGFKRFTPVATPRVSLLKSINDDISVYANFSQGYTPPSTSNVVIPYLGQVNKDLKPELGTQIEIGSKGSLFDKMLSYQVALFQVNITDKITPQSVTTMANKLLYTFYTNVGKQVDKGLEASLAYTFIFNEKSPVSVLRLSTTYSYSHFTYDEFKSDNNNNAKTVDYSGNKVSGVPPNIFSVGADVETKWGVYLYTTFKYVDKMPIDYVNLHYVDGYSLLDAKIGYKKQFGNFTSEIFAGGNNLSNSLYYTMMYINSTNAGLFLPGPYTATYYGGLNINYRF